MPGEIRAAYSSRKYEVGSNFADTGIYEHDEESEASMGERELAPLPLVEVRAVGTHLQAPVEEEDVADNDRCGPHLTPRPLKKRKTYVVANGTLPTKKLITDPEKAPRVTTITPRDFEYKRSSPITPIDPATFLHNHRLPEQADRVPEHFDPRPEYCDCCPERDKQQQFVC